MSLCLRHTCGISKRGSFLPLFPMQLLLLIVGVLGLVKRQATRTTESSSATSVSSASKTTTVQSSSTTSATITSTIQTTTVGPTFVLPSVTPTQSVPTEKPQQNQSSPASSFNSTTLYIVLGVIGGALVVGALGIYVIRKTTLKPSSQFRKRMDPHYNRETDEPLKQNAQPVPQRYQPEYYPPPQRPYQPYGQEYPQYVQYEVHEDRHPSLRSNKSSASGGSGRSARAPRTR
ncbi:hypothetical protein EDD86DRAFT_212965 [Gorgonomyces haynaldii]|nr:hypothetical protein EDD86DRAFT_212965 [Gorgonomyces haynaldii]